MIHLFFACWFESDFSQPLKQDVRTIEPNNDESITLQMFNAKSKTALKRPEVSLSDWSPEVVSNLANPQKVIGMSNFLRAPCKEEFEKGLSLAESLSMEQCSKSDDWVLMLDKSSEERTVEELLSQYAMPGPFFSVFEKMNTVFVKEGASELTLVHSRIQGLKFEVNLVLHNEGTVKGVYRCNSQIETDKIVGDNKCNAIKVEPKEEQAIKSFIESPYSTSSPVWLINGYAVNGLQSVRMLKHYSMYP